jgi:Prolyl oligopeptidase, N-terminal beta-propeller domain
MRSPALLMTLAVTLAPLARGADAPAPVDPNLWLEGVTDEKALAWVRERNSVSVKELAETPAFKTLEAGILAILDSDQKIPFVDKIGGHYYNFWRDEDHVRGLWRRTTLEEYRRAEPKWETVIDLDALGKSEGENWVWSGADCLRPAYQRCLISLSRGGADAGARPRCPLLRERRGRSRRRSQQPAGRVHGDDGLRVPVAAARRQGLKKACARRAFSLRLACRLRFAATAIRLDPLDRHGSDVAFVG